MKHFCSACGFSLAQFIPCPWCGFHPDMDVEAVQKMILYSGFQKIPSIEDKRHANFAYQIKPPFLSEYLTICGQLFFGIRLIQPSYLVARYDVRAMCNADMCQAYNTNWTCPPAIESIEECQKQILSFSHCILLQTVGRLEDSFDYEQMMLIEEKHNVQLQQCRDRIRLSYKNSLALGAGACRLCSPCTYPQAPCIRPYEAMPSMESFGLMVSEICKQANLTYYYGVNTISFTGCLLI